MRWNGLTGRSSSSSAGNWLSAAPWRWRLVLSIAPFAVFNLVAGASHLKFWQFMVGSLLRLTPGLGAITLFSDTLWANATDLTGCIEKAAMLHVIDGSLPYSACWTAGQPSAQRMFALAMFWPPSPLPRHPRMIGMPYRFSKTQLNSV